MIPLGILASAGGLASFELISTTVLGSSQSSVTFNLTAGQRAAYKHLQVRAVVSNDGAPAGVDIDNMYIRFNGDTAANYSHHRLWGNGSSAVSYASPSVNQMLGGIYVRNASTIFASNVIDILDAQSTTKNKTIRVLLGGWASSGNTIVGLNSGAWYSTSAISSVTLLTSANNFIAGSRFSLYGVRG